MLTEITNTLSTLITNLYISTGLLGIVLAMAIESCCIPLPSEIVMPLAGIMLSSGKILQGVNPWLALFLVGLAGAVGCLLGSMAAYGIGYKGGRPLMLKYGRYVLISQHDADLADRFFQRWGSATAFFSRLLPVVRTYISLPAGISKMPFLKFCVYTFLGSLPWCILLAYLGVLLGHNIESLSSIFHGMDVVIVAAVIILVALYIWRHIRNDRKARVAHAVEENKLQMSGSAPSGNQQQQFAQSHQPHQFQQPQWKQVPQSPQNGFPVQPGQQQPWGSVPSSPQPVQPQWGQFPQPAQAPQGWATQNQPEQQGQQAQQAQQPWGQQPQQPFPSQPSWPPRNN